MGSGSLRKAFCGGRRVHCRTQGMTSGNARLALATVFSLATRHKSGVHVCTPPAAAPLHGGPELHTLTGPLETKPASFLIKSK